MSPPKTTNLSNSRDLREDLLAEYLVATRTHGDDKDRATFDKIYGAYYTSLSRVVEPTWPTPKLRIVYTLQRQVELVFVDGKRYLVYDRYLGQTMNMLNRIVLNSKDPMDGEMYLFKLLAEEAAARGRLATSMLFSLSHLHLKSQHRGYRNDKNFDRRANITSLQEFFVLAHELAHLIVDAHSTNASIQQPASPSENHSKTLSRIATQIGFSEIDYEFSADFSMKLADDIPHRKTVELECLVDAVACLLVIRMIKNEKKSLNPDLTIAIALCLRHLRVIGIVRDILDGAWHDKNNAIESVQYTRDYIVRTSSIRSFLGHISKNFDIGSPEIIDITESYEALIDDPLMFSIVDKLNELNKLNGLLENDLTSLEARLRKELAESPAGEPSLEKILSMTGFLD